MDDLNGLDWNAPSSQPASRPPPLSNTGSYPSLKPTPPPPLSGRTTPSILPLQSAGIKAPATPSTFGKTLTPQNDSFANLLSFGAPAPSSKNLSLKEQQDLLQEQKKKQVINDYKQWDAQFGRHGSPSVSTEHSRTASPVGVGRLSSNNTQNQNLGQRTSSGLSNPLGSRSSSSRLQTTSSQQDEDDILAAFNSSAPVDASTNYPIPLQSGSSSRAPSVPPIQPDTTQLQSDFAEDDDDPFGLGTTSARLAVVKNQQPPVDTTQDEEDDVLGLLGKPVSELSPPKPSSPPPVTAAEGHPVDKAIAELVDMGFSAEKSRDALAATESGVDTQAAVGWLLSQAHAESRGKNERSQDRQSRNRRRETLEAEPDASAPAWMRQKSGSSTSRQQSEGHRSNGIEKDYGKAASDLGNNLFKTAGSLWKSGQKKLTKAVADFNVETDTAQPKWMKEASGSAELTVSRRRESSTVNADSARSVEPSPKEAVAQGVTDEALLLEVGRERPRPAKPKTTVRASSVVSSASPPTKDGFSKPTLPHRPNQQPLSAPQARQKLTRNVNDIEQAQAYISPARRRKAAVPKPQETEPDLLFDASLQQEPIPPTSSSIATPSPHSQRLAVTRPAAPPSSKPKAPPRTTPQLSSIALQSSTSNRNAGTAAFKLGNYADATSSYTAALRDIPSNHPLAIVLFTNRALTHLKTGDPKQCIADADSALEAIGSSKGISEKIDFGGSEGIKDMAAYWGKAMMRRAEAYEQLERWVEAAKIWKECVESGVGGSTSIQGRNRCEKAGGISNPTSQPTSRRPTPAPKKATPRPAVPRASALDDLSGRPSLPHAASSEAVTRLRAANEAAARADDEKFALSDAVAERVENWRKGKQDNLRALLGSLDTVLWADSGWKKVGMHELLNPNKVKVNYMKGIAKVHPDKVSRRGFRCPSLVLDSD